MSNAPDWAHIEALPLVAILRGLDPDRAEAIGDRLVEAGFRVLEVPLNRPGAIRAINRLSQRHGGRALVGAGTVRTPEQVAEVAGAGGRIIIMPHADTAVIRAAKDLGLLCLPGVATPSEAFAALDAGADALKLFPAEAMPPPVVKAMLAVLPGGTRLFPVGGIAPETMQPYRAAGAYGFGLGSALFKPEIDDAALSRNAEAFVAAWHAKGQATVAV
ncbi:2-dehydro-3-deoxy-6-phosphogalactonate aldolase [Marinivivus vitaminiproducens]|uniref:2-dehydro-3-deoxy-6-phosphogalactonate aldolase n=1 Tax=Marinivivus vitaminiproducens TaxID=3035935 RepID=UPI0027A10F27|nr:2-dehydro-3-deoxy-6-phosphogalactonate aldolase [Geminicoccaceae bacterium SCSIO 64248]